MKRMGFLGGILIGILLIGGIVYFLVAQIGDGNNAGPQNINSNQQDSFYKGKSKESWGCINLDDDSCYLKIAKESNFVPYSTCNFILDVNKKATCVAGAWSVLNDISICESINFGSVSGENSMGLKGQCYNDLAKSLKDPNLCEEISFDFNKDTCYTRYSLFNKDPSICSRISNSGKKRIQHSQQKSKGKI